MSSKHNSLTLWLSVLFLTVLTACGKDDAPIPAYRQNLAEIATDHNGRIVRIIPDNADTLTVTNRDVLTQILVPDTLYRVKAVYLQENREAEIVSLQSIFSMTPLSHRPDNFHQDAVKVKAAWRAGRYLNLLVAFKTSGLEKHVMAFVEDSISTRPDGSKRLHLTLAHDRRNDGDAYTTQSYLSCLLSGYQDLLETRRDSISISIPTDNGLTEKILPY